MRSVSGVGIETTPFSVLNGRGLKSLAAEAANAALADADVVRRAVLMAAAVEGSTSA